jgi:nucleoid DNA-binding protein
MTKSDVIKLVAEKTSLTRLQVKEVINATLQIIKEGTMSEGKVQLAEFGVFKKHNSPARKGRNPQSGAEIDIAAKTTMKFRAS